MKYHLPTATPTAAAAANQIHTIYLVLINTNRKHLINKTQSNIKTSFKNNNTIIITRKINLI